MVVVDNSAVKLAAVVNNAEHAMVLFDSGGIVEVFNQHAETFFGTQLRVGGTLQDMTGDSDCRAELLQAFNSHSAVVCEIQSDDNQWFTMNCKPIRHDDQFIGMILVVREVTATRRAEEQIRYQENLLESVSDAIISTNMDFKIVSWNHGAERMYGWRREQAFGHSVAEITRMEIVDGDIEAATEALVTHGYWEGEVIQQRRDGTPLHIYAKVTLVHDAGGDAIGAVSINRDITQRKRAESSLLDSEMRHRLITELIADYIYSAILDRQQSPYLEWITGKIQQISGYSFEELKALEHEWLTVMHPDDLARFQDDLQSQLLSNQSVVYEYRIFSKSGALRWLRDYMQPIWDDNEDRVVSILGAVQDITHQKQVEHARERELRTLEKLSGAPRAAITAVTYGLQSLHEAQPDTFDALVQVYDELLEDALEAQIYHVESHLSEHLRSLATRLGSLRAGPRDIVELHARALRRKADSSVSGLKVQAYTDEGRLMLIELMGYLVTYYRNYAIPSARNNDHSDDDE